MSHRSSLPVYQGMLRRPRLHAQIQKGLRHSLLVLLAGPGYGKTEVITSYLSNTAARVLWLHLTSLDNLYTHFWEHFIRGLEMEFPGLAKHLEHVDFPDTISKFNIFLNTLEKTIGRQREVVWVFDDFGEITDRTVSGFIGMMAKAKPENFHMVLLSDALSTGDSLSSMADDPFLITEEGLKFTKEEIAELYAMRGVLLEPDELKHLERWTGGWALPLHLLVLGHDGTPGIFRQDGDFIHGAVSLMFEERFFSGYPEGLRKLLVILSFLPSFPLRLARDLYEGDPEELDVLEDHVFIMDEPAMGRLSFHRMYRLFLQEKRPLLSSAEETRLWKRTAEFFEISQELGDSIQAISCYRKCGDRVSMLNVICDITRWQHVVTAANGAFFLEHLDLLTPEEVRCYPVADYLRAAVLISTLDLEKAEALLLDLERRLLGSGTSAALELLGDVYGSIGFIHMMRNQEDFGEYYKMAAGYLPEGTNFKAKNKLHNLNIHNFSMADNQPGARERMERAVHYGVPWMVRVLHGGMGGMEFIFSAEAAYLSYELDAAEQHAFRGIYKAEINAQHDLVCNGYCLLARIGLMRGNFSEVIMHIQSVVDYAEQYEFTSLKEIRDTALAWYYIKLQDPKKIPKSILTVNDSEQSPLAYGRVQIVYANYLIITGEFAKLVDMLEHPKGLFLTRGVWPDRICLFIMLAIGYYHLGNPEAAVEALWTAYDMSFHNRLITLFIEAEKHMSALIALARNQHHREFNPQWLDLIEKQAASYARRAEAVRGAYKKQSTGKTAVKNPLTAKEQKILFDLSRGLTREEIAVEHGLPVNTVKSAIRSISKKLNAPNRAEAVSIALSKGYIEIAMPE